MAALAPYPAYGNVRIVGPVSTAPPGIFYSTTSAFFASPSSNF
ncbi:hypothetical protein SEEM031_02457 [Salmonella enterica subsp. enterica serovar Montevideo str. SARB31]|nr:hypothetical protein SEEM031_02457 [Salmonella enterica subsp. enterica serovar Montevideo str. SARB31]